ncbi:MAG TPA: hypothetical protein VF316_03280 [Polyangiaceae bacterium]
MRTLLRASGILALVPALALLLLELTAPGTWSGIAYALGLGLSSLALVMVGRPPARRLAFGGAALLLGTIALRLATGAGGSDLQMKTGSATGSRWVNRVVDEKDLSVNAARTIRATQFMRDPDVAELPEAMEEAYERMRAAEGAVPSPVMATYLGLQGKDAYDDIEIGDAARANGVVVFLHGSAGGFTLPCWEVSQAATRANLATVCPSTGWLGDWWSAQGEAIVRATVADLRARGVKHLILAGLSNGGIGASRLLPRMPGTFEGFIAISGAAPDAPAPGIPVLALQGRNDAQVSASVVHAYCMRAGGHYVEYDGGHFALLLHEKEAVDAMAAWLTVRVPARDLASN